MSQNTPYTAVYSCERYGCGQMWSMKTDDPEYNDSRKCKVCDYYVEPICVIYTKGFYPNLNHKYFGQFICDDCGREWCSRYSWLGFQQMCKGCADWVYPHILQPLERKSMGKTVRAKPHEQDLCEKCEKLGYNCITN